MYAVLIPIKEGSNITVDWGDGSPIETYTGAGSESTGGYMVHWAQTVETPGSTVLDFRVGDQPYHEYATDELRDIQITGTITDLYPFPLLPGAGGSFNNQLKDVKRWGNVGIGFPLRDDPLQLGPFLQLKFTGAMAPPTINATDAPSILPGSNLKYLLTGVDLFGSAPNDLSNVRLANWDLSNVDSVKDMVTPNPSGDFPVDLSTWNVDKFLNELTSLDDLFDGGQPFATWENHLRPVFNGNAPGNGGEPGEPEGPLEPGIGLFYGGYSTTGGTLSVITMINSLGTLSGSESTTYASTSSHAGAEIGETGVFYGSSWSNPHVVLINTGGTVENFTLNVGTARTNLAGVGLGSHGIFYGGYNGVDGRVNLLTRFTDRAVLVGSETNIGTARNQLSGAETDANGLFYGGWDDTGTQLNLVTAVDSNGNLIGNEATVGTGNYSFAGTSVGGNAMYFGGEGDTGFTNRLIIINSGMSMVGNEGAIGSARGRLAGATVATNGMFYGGLGPSTDGDKVTRINSSNALVGSETIVGTPRQYLAGASL